MFGGLANLHDTASVYFLGTLTALLWFPIVVPYGLLCQYAMTRAWQSARNDGGFESLR